MKWPPFIFALSLSSIALIGAEPLISDKQLFRRLWNPTFFHRVTKERVPLAAKYASLCGELRNPADHTTLTGKRDSAIHVHVSPEALEAFREERYPLPEGTIILKEKFSSPDAASPELYTGMLKREKGYNPKVGDWEFFTLSGDRHAITSRGRIDSCMDCHQARAKSDYLMRASYREYIDLSEKK